LPTHFSSLETQNLVEQMTFAKTIDDLVQIVANGGGLDLHIDANGGHFARPTPDLVRLVSNASPKSTITLRGAGSRPTPDLVQVSRNASGSVIFVLE